MSEPRRCPPKHYLDDPGVFRDNDCYRCRPCGADLGWAPMNRGPRPKDGEG